MAWLKQTREKFFNKGINSVILTQGAFLFLPNLTNVQIQNDRAASLEYKDDPHRLNAYLEM
jgi:hypothetical protein